MPTKRPLHPMYRGLTDAQADAKAAEHRDAMAVLEVILAHAVATFAPDDIIAQLARVFSLKAEEDARKRGDYASATVLNWIVTDLEEMEERIENRISSQETL